MSNEKKYIKKYLKHLCNYLTVNILKIITFLKLQRFHVFTNFSVLGNSIFHIAYIRLFHQLYLLAVTRITKVI